eukprot:UN28361
MKYLQRTSTCSPFPSFGREASSTWGKTQVDGEICYVVS